MQCNGQLEGMKAASASGLHDKFLIVPINITRVNYHVK